MIPFRDIFSPKNSKGKEPLSLANSGGKSKRKINKIVVETKNNSRKEKRSPSMLILLPEETLNNKSRQVMYAVSIGIFALCSVFLLTSVYLSTSSVYIKKTVVEQVSTGFEAILNGSEFLAKREFKKAKESFTTARHTFSSMQKKMWFLLPSLRTPAQYDPLFKSASSLIAAGSSFAEAGSLFTHSTEKLSTLPETFLKSQNLTALQKRNSLTKELREELPSIEKGIALLGVADQNLRAISNTFIPLHLQERYRFGLQVLEAATSGLKEVAATTPALLTLLGDSAPHTTLILLQNSAELRPSGGFIGNFMVIETNEGYITKQTLSDVYAADHELSEVIEPPAEIAAINPRWYLRDSNYSGHFPLSAQKAAWFLEKEKGPGVDTVIAIDQRVIEKLLELTGPVQSPDLTKPFTSENFSLVLSYIIESKIYGRENPKAILGNFMPIFEEAIFKKSSPTAALSLLQELIESKHIVAYSTDPNIQSFFIKYGLAGLMQAEESNSTKINDYLSVVHTSIGGNKSDSYMNEAITHETFLENSGAISDEITIKRSHTWNVATDRRIRSLVSSFGFKTISKEVWEILGRSRNLHMLRIYVPKGSTLEESSDPRLKVLQDPELDMTYFSVPMLTEVSRNSTLKVRYKLPFTMEDIGTYAFKIQKQPGQDNIFFTKKMTSEGNAKAAEYFPNNGKFDTEGTWFFEQTLNKDAAFTSVWKI